MLHAYLALVTEQYLSPRWKAQWQTACLGLLSWGTAVLPPTPPQQLIVTMHKRSWEHSTAVNLITTILKITFFIEWTSFLSSLVSDLHHELKTLLACSCSFSPLSFTRVSPNTPPEK